jgi:hypothetical protein
MYVAKLKPAQRLAHTVAFRLTDREYLELLPFFESCGGGSAALRWLLSQDATKATMQAAVQEANA